MSQPKLERHRHSDPSQLRSTILVRWVGYGLLLLSLVDLFAILIPPEFMNPVWEFRSIGALVERIPVPLIGLVLVFWGEQNHRHAQERILLKGLSWLTLTLAVVLLALVPLCLVDSNRIHDLKIAEVSTLKGQRLDLVDQLDTKLSQANSVDELQQLLNRALNSRSPVALDTSQPLLTVKAQIPTILASTRSDIERQARASQVQISSERGGLLKRTVKWSLGALIGAVICWRIWQNTRWARKKSSL